MDSEGETPSSSSDAGAEGSVTVHIQDGLEAPAIIALTSKTTTSRQGRYESNSRRNCWLSFPPGPIDYTRERIFELKASQVAVDPSPDRVRTYEIKVKNLFYRIPPPRHTKLGRLTKMIQKVGLLPSEDEPSSAKVRADRYILRNINFEAKPGELLAIAGPSGAGKSTLLEVLAGRVKPSIPSPPDCVLINGQLMDVHQFQRVSGYVMQDDALFPHLTVMETLLYSARLRLPATIPHAEKVARVKTVLEELGLTHVANTRIGNESMRGVSGGERRRVSIGLDVIHNPAVLFLDEPTSGLDSAAAANIVEVLKVMAECQSRCVILTIHQPSIRILLLMHSILLLADGMIVHHGSLDLLAMRLEVAGHKIPPQVNVLEYAIDAINSKEADAIKVKHATGVKKPKLRDFLRDLGHDPEKAPETDDVENSSLKPWTDEEYQDYLKRAWGTDTEDEDDKVTYSNTRVQETVVLAQRFFKNIWRPKELFTARTFQALIAGICLGTIFLKVDDDQGGVAERMGFMSFSLSFLLSGTTEGLPIFLEERHIVMRESSRGAYRLSSYVLSSSVIFAPFLLVMGLVFSIPSYWLIALNSSVTAFLFFCLVMWLVLLMANSFVSFFAALSQNYIMGNSLIAACMGAFILFSGFFISKDKIPDYWIFMHYLSLAKYPLEALLINEYANEQTKCFGPLDPVTGACSLTGKHILHQAGIHHNNKWMNVGIMCGFVVAYRLGSYFILCFKLSRRRR